MVLVSVNVIEQEKQRKREKGKSVPTRNTKEARLRCIPGRTQENKLRVQRA